MRAWGTRRLSRCVVAAALALPVLHVDQANAGVAPLVRSRIDSELQQRMAELDALRTALAAVPRIGVKQALGKRRALVIGNNTYLNIRSLRKARDDAKSIAEQLKALDFEVMSDVDLDIDRFEDLLAQFYDSLQPGDSAVVFYSGHGSAFEGVNYLLPSDAPLLGTEDGRKLRRVAINANEILADIKAREVEMALMVLDACRDDPFDADNTRASLPFRGLAPMDPSKGMFVIYSAGIGEKALDNLGPSDPDPNSIFTRKFIPILATPGLPLVDIAKRTQVEVRELAKSVSHTQAPAYYDQVIGQYYFTPPQPKMFGFTLAINDYEREDLRMKGAANDGERVARALEALGADDVTRIFNRDARRQFVEYAWKKTVAEARPGDTIVFSFSGQTGQRGAPAGSGEADDLDEYLKLADFTGEGDDSDAVVTDDTLTAWMELAAAKNINVVLLIDGSFGGGLLDREFANVSFIGASAEGETTYVYKVGERDHGAASAAFASGLEGDADLNGDGYISQRELFYQVSRGVLDVARLRQTPQFAPDTGPDGRRLSGATDIPLFRIPYDVEARPTTLERPWPGEAAR